MARNKRDVAIVRRKHASRIEPDTETGGVRAGESSRQHDPGTGLWPLDVGIGDPVSMAVREAVEGALLSAGNAIELILGTVVADPVAARL